MFDTLAPRGPASRRVRNILVTASVVLHATAIAALALAAMWRTDKVHLEDPSVVRSAFVLPGLPPPAGGAAKRDLKPADRPKKRPKDTVQPDTTPSQAVAATQAATGPADGPDGPGGEGPGIDVTATDPDGTCLAPPCGPGKDPPEEPKCKDGSKPPCKPIIVRKEIAEALRISGNERIQAPDTVRVQMRHAGKEKLIGTFRVCIGATGGVSSVTPLRSTGYDDYDDKIVREMRAWRYRPYSVDGVGQPFCYAVTLMYVMKD